MSGAMTFATQPVPPTTYANDRSEDVIARADGGTAVAWSNGDRLYLSLFDDAGIAEGDPIRIDVPGQFEVRDPDVIELPDGRLLVSWHQRAAFGADATFEARFFNADGTPDGPSFTLFASHSRSTRGPDVAVLDDGTLIVTGVGPNSAFDPNLTTGISVLVRQFAADGTPLTDPMQVFGDIELFPTGPEVVALENGGFVIAWGGGWTGNLVDLEAFGLQLYDADLQPVSVTLPRFEVPPEYLPDFGNPRIAPLSDGGFVLAVGFNDEDFLYNDGVVALTVNSDGTIGSAPQVTLNDTDLLLLDVVGTPDDGYALLMRSRAGFPNTDLRYVRVASDGTPVFDTLVNDPGDRIIDGHMTVTGNGHVTLAWSEYFQNSFVAADALMTAFGPDLFGTEAGDDILMPLPGPGEIDGRGGTDTADYSAASGRVLVDLDRDVSGEGFARFFDAGAGSGNTFTSIENVTGGAMADNLRGDAGANVIEGGGVSDRLYGREGDDTIDGGTGFDAIFGNNGADLMIGGAGGDRFIYFRATDTGVGSGNRDVIDDFTPGEDRIEIRRIDADITQGFKQSFDFIGDAAFSGTAGELRFEQQGGITLVQADRDGDGAADFEIELTGTLTLTSDDFLI